MAKYKDTGMMKQPYFLIYWDGDKLSQTQMYDSAEDAQAVFQNLIDGKPLRPKYDYFPKDKGPIEIYPTHFFLSQQTSHVMQKV